MTPADLSTLARDLAEAAAKCVGGDPSQAESATYPIGGREAAGITCAAGDWRLHATAVGPAGATASHALNAATVLNLRDRVVAQRFEREKMLRADLAAIEVIDGTARMYDAALIVEAVAAMESDPAEVTRMQRGVFAHLTAGNLDVRGPWTRAEIDEWDSGIADACDAILRRRAMGGAP